MKPNILVVDDDVEIRELLQQVLSRANFQVTQVKDGAGLKDAMGRMALNILITLCPVRT